jgi:flagellar biosynthetic protein FliP
MPFTRLFAVLCSLVIGFATHAQVVYGPPAPGSPAAASMSSPGSMSAADSINPIEILAGAGDILGGSGQAQSMIGPRRTADEIPDRSGLSTVVNILVVLTVVSLAPSIMLMMTCFTRIIIVLGLLKQALGAQSIPPPQVITALAMFMTMLVMAPTLDRINNEAIAPYRAGQITTYDELWTKAKQPMRDFMFNQIEATGNWSSLYMVMERRGIDISDPTKLTRADVDMVSLVPAFMLSELKTAFLMGFRVYLPFLVIDMVISTMLIAMGMMMLPPVLISLPFKLLLFVLVDGWALIVGSLMDSVAPGVAAVSLLSASPPGFLG